MEFGLNPCSCSVLMLPTASPLPRSITVIEPSLMPGRLSNEFCTKASFSSLVIATWWAPSHERNELRAMTAHALRFAGEPRATTPAAFLFAGTEQGSERSRIEIIQHLE